MSYSKQYQYINKASVKHTNKHTTYAHIIHIKYRYTLVYVFLVINITIPVYLLIRFEGLFNRV